MKTYLTLLSLAGCLLTIGLAITGVGYARPSVLLDTSEEHTKVLEKIDGKFHVILPEAVVDDKPATGRGQKSKQVTECKVGDEWGKLIKVAGEWCCTTEPWRVKTPAGAYQCYKTKPARPRAKKAGGEHGPI